MYRYKIYICNEAQEYCLKVFHCSRVFARNDPPTKNLCSYCYFISKPIKFLELIVCEIAFDKITMIPFSTKPILVADIETERSESV